MKKTKLYELAKKLEVTVPDLVNFFNDELNQKVAMAQYLTPIQIEQANIHFGVEVKKETMPLFGIYQRADKSWAVVEFEFTTPRQEIKFVKEYDDDGALKYKSTAVLCLENVMQFSKIYQDSEE